MAKHNIPAYEVNIDEHPRKIFEAARAVQLNGGMTYDGLNKSRRELKVAGVDLDIPDKMEKLVAIGKQTIRTLDNQSSISLAAPTDSEIGINTFEISNQLIQDASPENAMENSPINIMLPNKTIDAVQYQQDILSSNWGWADGDNGVNGASNAVSLLETQSNSWKGFTTREMSFMSGQDLINLRAVGTSDTERQGAMQKLNYGMLNLLQRASTGLEMNRLESLIKGSWTYKEGSLPDDLIISSQIPAGNVTTLTQSLGAYNSTTNVFTPNAGMTVNPLVQLGQMLTTIKNMGLDIEKIVMDNISYGAIFNSTAVASQTQYVTMNSNNDVMGVRANLFKITTIPALQDVPIEVDNRAVKINSAATTRSNTRPLWWGKTVTTSSFRALVVVKPKGLTRVGDFGFFPNIYARTTQIGGGTRSMGGYGGGVVMVTQDLSQFDVTNQKIQILAASASAPIIYLPNLVFTFDLNVTIS